MEKRYMKRQIELIIEVPDNYDDVHVDLCVEDMHINEHFKIVSSKEAREEVIPTGTIFVDNIGCVFEVVGPVDTYLCSYWCRCVSDETSLLYKHYKYDILEGVKRYWGKTHD